MCLVGRMGVEEFQWRGGSNLPFMEKDFLLFFFSPFPPLQCFWKNKLYSPLCVYLLHFIYFPKNMVMEKMKSKRNGNDIFSLFLYTIINFYVKFYINAFKIFKLIFSPLHIQYWRRVKTEWGGILLPSPHFPSKKLNHTR